MTNRRLTVDDVNFIARRLGVRITRRAASEENLTRLAEYLSLNKMGGKFIETNGAFSIVNRDNYTQRNCILYEAYRLDTGILVGFVLMAKKFKRDNHFHPDDIIRDENVANPENDISVILDICSMKPAIRLGQRSDDSDSDSDDERKANPLHQGIQGVGSLLMCMALTQIGRHGCVLFVSRRIVKWKLDEEDEDSLAIPALQRYLLQRQKLRDDGEENKERNQYSSPEANALYSKFGFTTIPGSNAHVSRYGGATQRYRMAPILLQEAERIMAPYIRRHPKAPRSRTRSPSELRSRSRSANRPIIPGQAIAASRRRPSQSRSRSPSYFRRFRRRSPGAVAAADPPPARSQSAASGLSAFAQELINQRPRSPPSPAPSGLSAFAQELINQRPRSRPRSPSRSRSPSIGIGNDDQGHQNSPHRRPSRQHRRGGPSWSEQRDRVPSRRAPPHRRLYQSQRRASPQNPPPPLRRGSPQNQPPPLRRGSPQNQPPPLRRGSPQNRPPPLRRGHRRAPPRRDPPRRDPPRRDPSHSPSPRARSPFYCGMHNPPPVGQILGNRLQCFRKGYGAGLGNQGQGQGQGRGRGRGRGR